MVGVWRSHFLAFGLGFSDSNLNLGWVGLCAKGRLAAVVTVVLWFGVSAGIRVTKEPLEMWSHGPLGNLHFNMGLEKLGRRSH